MRPDDTLNCFIDMPALAISAANNQSVSLSRMLNAVENFPAVTALQTSTGNNERPRLIHARTPGRENVRSGFDLWLGTPFNSAPIIDAPTAAMFRQSSQ